MKKIPNHTVTELQRLVPLIIDNVSDTKNTRVLNAIRITKKIIKKLDNLKDIENEGNRSNRERSKGCI